MKRKTTVIFNQNKIRRLWDEKKELWYFSVIDVISALTDSSIPKRYWSDLKSKLSNEGSEVYEKIVQLKFQAKDGKKYNTDCLSAQDMLRLIQSIPSPKAEPFKLWLARVGYERLEETADPEITINRALQTYQKKGYSLNWINQRLKSIEVRRTLTEEWGKRGVKQGREFAILTDEITKAWAGLSTKQYKKLKSLKKEGLRDNMTNLELILNMLAETATTEISQQKKPKGFLPSKKVAQTGGKIAGTARREIESQTGKKVVSKKNAESLKTRDQKRLKKP
jgi:hypothetical protein